MFFNLCAQKYSRGLILESEDDYKVSRSPLLSQIDYSNIPEQFSLKNFAPEPGNQGPYSTCGAWATSYSARSLTYILANDIPSSLKKNYYFSPSFVYNQLKSSPNCESGISLKEALDIIKEKGSLFLTEFEYSCEKNITQLDLYKSKNYAILDYRQIFSRQDTLKVKKVKKSISEYHPVIIAMACPSSFDDAKQLWIPRPEEYITSQSGHAVVVIGYDDSKFGGAFEILNSWGTSWGEGGFCWIKYSDFEHFAYYGYDLLENQQFYSHKPITGSVYLKLDDGRFIQFIKENQIFSTKKNFPAETKFEIFISVNNAVYISCFAIDDKNNFTLIFPKDSLTNNFFPYSRSTFPIPDEIHYMKLDDRGNEDYIVLLVSQKYLDIKQLLLKTGSSNLKFDKIINLLSRNFNKSSFDLINDSDRINFSSLSNPDNYIPIILKIRKTR